MTPTAPLPNARIATVRHQCRRCRTRAALTSSGQWQRLQSSFLSAPNPAAQSIHDFCRCLAGRRDERLHVGRPRDARSSGATHRTRPARHHRGDRSVARRGADDPRGPAHQSGVANGQADPDQDAAGFDFSFRPSLDRNRITALAALDFIGGMRRATRWWRICSIGAVGRGSAFMAADRWWPAAGRRRHRMRAVAA
jgi:hypothetical protein